MIGDNMLQFVLSKDPYHKDPYYYSNLPPLELMYMRGQIDADKFIAIKLRTEGAEFKKFLENNYGTDATNNIILMNRIYEYNKIVD